MQDNNDANKQALKHTSKRVSIKNTLKIICQNNFWYVYKCMDKRESNILKKNDWKYVTKYLAIGY